MIGNYVKDADLYLKCMALINDIFPGAGDMAHKGDKYGACWANTSTPIYYERDNEISGHIGCIPFVFNISGKMYQTAAIHAVCVKESLRGSGLYASLMQEAIDYINKQYDFAFLFTDQPFLYQKFGFMPVYPWYQWKYQHEPKMTHQPLTSREIILDESEDIKLFKRLLEEKQAHHEHFHISGSGSDVIFLLNAMYCTIRYFDDLDAIVVYKKEDGGLNVKDLLCSKPVDLDHLLSTLAEDCKSVTLGFDASEYLGNKKLTPILNHEHGCMMINRDIELPKIFVYPELYRC